MKYVWTLFVIIPVGLMIFAFLYSQKYKNTFVPPTPTPTPINTTTTFCRPEDLEATLITEGAAGNIYGTFTIKNISSNTCSIQGDKFVAAKVDAANVIPDKQGDAGPAAIELSPNQTVYSQMHFPNGPQCTSGIVQSPVTFTYQISSSDKVTFMPGGNNTKVFVTACKASSEVTQLDVWSMSLQSLH